MFSAKKRLGAWSGILLAAVFVAGCGTNYHSVVTPITTSGPAPQPSAYAAFISVPPASGGVSNDGILNVVDYSGDSIIDQAIVGIAPIGFLNDQSGSSAFTLNSDHTLSGLVISSSFLSRQVTTTSLLPSTSIANLFTLSSVIYALGTNTTNGTGTVDIFKGSPGAYTQSLTVPTGPITAAGVSGGERIYVVSQGVAATTCANPASVTTKGTVTAIESSSYTVDTPGIQVGVCPVFAIPSSDGRRIFVLNRTSGTVSVIDATKNALDTTITVGAGPVYAEYYAAGNLLITANYDGSSISVIDVGVDIYGNDTSTFGNVKTIPVGTNPAAVTVLADGSRAYTANYGNGTVSIVNLGTYSVTGTITLPLSNATKSAPHPRSIASIKNSIYGKVYVTSPDSFYATIINTDGDYIATSLDLNGNVLDVRITSPNASGSSNANITTRMSGSGQP